MVLKFFIKGALANNQTTSNETNMYFIRVTNVTGRMLLISLAVSTESFTVYMFLRNRKFKKTFCNQVLKMSWKTKRYFTEDVFKRSSRHLQHFFTKTNVS